MQPLISELKRSLRCDECGSHYSADAATMSILCPECAHWLYRRPTCHHELDSDGCNQCRWDGSRTSRILKVIRRDAPHAIEQVTCPSAPGFWRGTVKEIFADPMRRVRRGDPLCLIQSTSSFLSVEAPADGMVIHIRAQAGDRVEAGRMLFDFLPALVRTNTVCE